MKLKRALFNPFIHIAGGKALAIGLVMMIVIALITPYTGVLFHGAFGMQNKRFVDFGTAAICLAVGYVSLVVVFWLMSLLLAKKTRLIDIAGTFALARWPYIIAALSGLLIEWTVVGATGNAEKVTAVYMSLIAIICMALLFVAWIWSLTLMYNAYKVSTGLRGTKCAISFIVGAIAAQGLSLVCGELLDKLL